MSSTRHLRWLARRSDTSGEDWFRIGRAGEKLVAEWVGIATLIAEPDGTSFVIEPAKNADPAQLEKVRTGSAYALVWRLRGKLAFHGSAVAIGDHAILLLGRNAAGKSTAAAHLCAAGALMLADDIAVLEGTPNGFLIEPRERNHWLLADACEALGVDIGPTEKTMSPAPQVAQNPVRLVAAVTLNFGDGPPALESIKGLEAMAELVPSLLRFALDDDVVQMRDIDALLNFSDEVPIFRLTRPRDLHRLKEAGTLLQGLAMGEGLGR